MTDVGFITYVENGDECGIFNIEGTTQKHHYVCKDGHYCMLTKHFDNSQSSVCRKDVKLLGDKCIHACDNAIPCLQNEYNEFTCGGVVVLQKNEFELSTPHYNDNKIDTISVVLGTLIISFILCVKLYKLK